MDKEDLKFFALGLFAGTALIGLFLGFVIAQVFR